MENPPSNSQALVPETSAFSWAVFANRILKAGFALLVFGAVIILLAHFNHMVPSVVSVATGGGVWAVAGGAAVLVLLTVVGVPLVPAAVAGFASWLLIQKFVP
jgi:hypothetical protein